MGIRVPTKRELLLSTLLYSFFVFFVCSFAGQDGFLEHCQKLLEKFRYPWELMPLMYVILKDAGTDIDEATRRIEEGKPNVNNEIALKLYASLVIYMQYQLVYKHIYIYIYLFNPIPPGQYVVNEYSRQHNLNIYDGGELRNTTRQCG